MVFFDYYSQDTEFHQLVRSWLLCTTCRPPVISKTFDINVEVGGGKGSQKVKQDILEYIISLQRIERVLQPNKGGI